MGGGGGLGIQTISFLYCFAAVAVTQMENDTGLVCMRHGVKVVSSSASLMDGIGE